MELKFILNNKILIEMFYKFIYHISNFKTSYFYYFILYLYLLFFLLVKYF